jgi:hypothetical protein
MSDGDLRRQVIYPTCDRLRIPRVSWHGFLEYLGIPASVAQAPRFREMLTVPEFDIKGRLGDDSDSPIRRPPFGFPTPY